MEDKGSICGICDCVISDNTLFAGLGPDELDAFKEAVKTVSYKAKEFVFMEGDKCKGLYVIRVGRVKLVRSSRSGKEQIIKILGPGDLLGLEVFAEEDAYLNSTVCMEDSELCFMTREDFLRILKDEPGVSGKLIFSLGRELSGAYERIGTLGLLNAREKMAHLLFSLATDYGSGEGDVVRLNLRLSRLELAELLGITQETSIRLLKSFKDEGIIEIKRKEIVIISMEKLAEVGGVA